MRMCGVHKWGRKGFGMAQNVDRNSPIPAYYQIAMDLMKRISRQEWEAYQQLPSESDLAEYYSVSRVTLRQALAELEKDGIISKYRGKGAFINANPVPFVHDFNYALVLEERISQHGFSMTAEVLEQRLLDEPYPNIVEGLMLRPDEKAIYLKRLFFLDERPIAIGRSWLSEATVPGFESCQMVDNSLSRTLDAYYHMKPVRVEDILEVVRPTQSERELLKTSYDAPLLIVKGISYLQDGRPLEYSNTSWSGDNVRFRFALKQTENGFVMNP